jgi:hypothetical protein
MGLRESTKPEISMENAADLRCSACNMPLTKNEDFGTNADGSKNEKYCCHCMQSGNLM